MTQIKKVASEAHFSLGANQIVRSQTLNTGILFENGDSIL